VNAKEFIIQTHANLLDLAAGNAAIGLRAQETEGLSLGCMYGVGLGYYEAAESFRNMAIKSSLVSPEDLPRTNWKEFRNRVAEQAGSEHISVTESIVCPLNQLAPEARSTLPGCRVPHTRNSH
jgi:hypothetical protein